MWKIGLEYDYFLQLEDDLVIDRGFFQFLMMQIQQRKDDPDWVSLEFSDLGFIGKLFRKTSLQDLIIYTKLFYRIKPIDVIYWAFVKMQACLPSYDPERCKSLANEVAVPVHGKNFLHHVGRVSSLQGKISHLGDLNPTIEAGKVVTNLNKKDVLEFYYGKRGLFLEGSQKDTTMEFHFDHRQSPQNLVITSGTIDFHQIIPADIKIDMVTSTEQTSWTNNPPGKACFHDKQGIFL